MSSKRSPWYIGPEEDIEPSDLSLYERQGYVIEPKIDGMWASLHVGSRSNTLDSRDANTPPITGENAGDLLGIETFLPTGTVLVGELETSSDWGAGGVNGSRKIHLFDCVRVGREDLSRLTWRDRRENLASLFAQMQYRVDHRFRDRFVLVPYKERDFEAYFKSYTDKGGEGIVLKDPRSIYESHRASRKVDFWKRCKRIVTEDYVLMHIERTPKNQLTGAWGLFRDGKLFRVFRAMVPKQLLTEANCGTLVAEFRGWGMNEDRVLRHASFVRVRADKLPKSCSF
jgi:hypothetical protein